MLARWIGAENNPESEMRICGESESEALVARVSVLYQSLARHKCLPCRVLNMNNGSLSDGMMMRSVRSCIVAGVGVVHCWRSFSLSNFLMSAFMQIRLRKCTINESLYRRAIKLLPSEVRYGTAWSTTDLLLYKLHNPHSLFSIFLLLVPMHVKTSKSDISLARSTGKIPSSFID